MEKEKEKLFCEQVKAFKNIVVRNQYGRQYVFYGAESITIENDGDTIKIKVVE